MYIYSANTLTLTWFTPNPTNFLIFYANYAKEGLYASNILLKWYVTLCE